MERERRRSGCAGPPWSGQRGLASVAHQRCWWEGPGPVTGLCSLPLPLLCPAPSCPDFFPLSVLERDDGGCPAHLLWPGKSPPILGLGFTLGTTTKQQLQLRPRLSNGETPPGSAEASFYLRSQILKTSNLSELRTDLESDQSPQADLQEGLGDFPLHMSYTGYWTKEEEPLPLVRRRSRALGGAEQLLGRRILFVCAKLPVCQGTFPQHVIFLGVQDAGSGSSLICHLGQYIRECLGYT